MAETIIGVLGGTGLYAMEGLTKVETLSLETPYGWTSSPITGGKFDGAQFYFIARHGIGHTLLPTEVNSLANIYALKSLGVTWCVGVSAVGSLREDYAPGHLVLPDQIIDRTQHRQSTFFGNGIVAHVGFADPYCQDLRSALHVAADEVLKPLEGTVHFGGTLVTMEGPQFSTRAESELYRSWGASLIGMTALPEAKLAREAELAYATLALVTDYDCWHSRSEDVDVTSVLAMMSKNVGFAREILKRLPAKLIGKEPAKSVADALEHAIITKLELIPPHRKEELYPLLIKYL